jgi:hypothetical protein
MACHSLFMPLNSESVNVYAPNQCCQNELSWCKYSFILHCTLMFIALVCYQMGIVCYPETAMGGHHVWQIFFWTLLLVNRWHPGWCEYISHYPWMKTFVCRSCMIHLIKLNEDYFFLFQLLDTNTTEGLGIHMCICVWHGSNTRGHY